MNRQEHVIIGIIIFAAFTWLFYYLVKIPVDIIIYGGIGAVIGSIIPDILEPATNWMHRGFGHSKRALKFTGKIFAITALLGLFSFFISMFFIFYVIASFFLGYVAHLLADGTTAVGLPD
ncbi:MAG: metal-dependent hydrolase [Methanomicrobiales archaeon]|jgi:membrane-bound metal-dependent hydrolase YbcI (DUF457 family)